MPEPENEARRIAERYARMNDGELEMVAEASADLTEEARIALKAELEKRQLLYSVSEAPPLPAPSPDDDPDDEPWLMLRRFGDLTKAANAKEALDAAEIDSKLVSLAGMDWFVSNVVGGVKLLVRPEDLETAQEVLDDATLEADFQNWSVVKQFRDLPEATIAKGAVESAGIECHLTDENLVRMDWFWSNLIGGVKLVAKPEDVAAAQQVLEQGTPPKIEYAEGEDFNQPACPKCGSYDIFLQDMAKGVALAGLYVAGLPIPITSREWRCQSCGAAWAEEREDSQS